MRSRYGETKATHGVLLQTFKMAALSLGGSSYSTQ
jgi:hypothetical protein